MSTVFNALWAVFLQFFVFPNGKKLKNGCFFALSSTFFDSLSCSALRLCRSVSNNSPCGIASKIKPITDLFYSQWPEKNRRFCVLSADDLGFLRQNVWDGSRFLSHRLTGGYICRRGCCDLGKVLVFSGWQRGETPPKRYGKTAKSIDYS